MKTLTGNTGSTVTPNSQGDTKIIGEGNVSVEGVASLHTLKITASNAKDASTTQKGVVELATEAEVLTGTDSTKPVVPSSLKSKLGDQTDHSIPIAKGSTKKLNYETLDDGELLIGATGKDPKAATLTSSNSTVVFTTGENSLDLKTGDRVPTAIGVDGGGAAIPAGNRFDLQGGSNCNISASGSTVTVDVTHPSSQDASTTKKGVLMLATDAETQVGTVTNKAVVPSALKYKLGDQTNHGLAYGKGTGEKIKWTAGLTDGQIVIGDTDGTPKAANVTSSNSTLSITKGSNSLDLKASPAIPNKVVTNSGTAIPRNNQMSMGGGKGVETSALGENVIVKIDGTVADKFTGDAGQGAVPVGSVIQFEGGTNINTVATGNKVTINATGGGGGGGGDLTFDTDSGVAKSASNVIDLEGGNLISTTGAGKKVTFNLPTTVINSVGTDRGTLTPSNNRMEVHGSDRIDTEVDPTNRDRMLIKASKQLISSIGTNGRSIYGENHSFNLTGGKGISTDQGSTDNDLVITNTEAISDLEFSDTKSPEGIAKPVSNKIEMHGDTGIDVTCSGKRVRFATKGIIPTSITTDSGTATPSSNSFQLKGGSNVSTSARGNLVTITSSGSGGGSGIESVSVNSGGDVTPDKDGNINLMGLNGIATYGQPNTHSIAISTTYRHNIVTSPTLVTPDKENLIHLGNTPASEGMTIQLPAAKVGQEMSFVSINSTYPGFEIFPPGGGKIWIGDQSTTTAPADGALGVARVKSTKRGDVLRLICIVENKEWQAISKIGTFELK